MINFSTALTNEVYLNLRYQMIKWLEEGGSVSLTPYVDSVGLPTIGLGFLLAEGGGNQETILTALGYNPTHPDYSALTSVLNQTYSPGDTAALAADIESVLGSSHDFAFENEDEIEEVFEEISEIYEGYVDNAIGAGVGADTRERHERHCQR